MFYARACCGGGNCEAHLVAMPTFYGDLRITHIPIGTSILFTTGGDIYDARSQGIFRQSEPTLSQGYLVPVQMTPFVLETSIREGKSHFDFKQLLCEFLFLF